MPRTYETADAELFEQVRSIMAQHHPQLFTEKVTFQILIARGPVNEDGELTAPAIMIGGYSALAKVKVTSLTDRVKGMADAELQLDGDVWAETSDQRQEAIIDRELMRLELVTKLNGPVEVVQRDDVGRPKLRLRKYDWTVAGFDAVADRHKADATEVMAIEALGRKAVRQGWLPGF